MMPGQMRTQNARWQQLLKVFPFFGVGNYDAQRAVSTAMQAVLAYYEVNPETVITGVIFATEDDIYLKVATDFFRGEISRSAVFPVECRGIHRKPVRNALKQDRNKEDIYEARVVPINQHSSDMDVVRNAVSF